MFKARLVAKWYRQKDDADHFDTFALVFRITSIKVLLVLGSVYNHFVHQMGVKTTIISNELD